MQRDSTKSNRRPRAVSSVLGMLDQRYLRRYADRSVQRVGYKNMKLNREVRARDIDGVIREEPIIEVIGVEVLRKKVLNERSPAQSPEAQ